MKKLLYIFLISISIFNILNAKVVYSDKKYVKHQFKIKKFSELSNKILKKDYIYLRSIMSLTTMFDKKSIYYLEITYDRKIKKHFKRASIKKLNGDYIDILYVTKYRNFNIRTNISKNKYINDVYLSKKDLEKLNANLKLPKILKPLKYKYISSSYSNHRFHPILKKYMHHNGIDFVAKKNTKILSVLSGTIIKIGWNGSYGKYIKIKHSNGIVTEYAHLNKYAKGMRKWKIVKQGQLIGYLGNTGRSTGPHLHFGVKKGKKFVDPSIFFKDRTRKSVVVSLTRDNRKLNKNYGLYLAVNKVSKKIDRLRRKGKRVASFSKSEQEKINKILSENRVASK